MPSLSPFIIAIPARHASTRLPGKPLRRLGGEALIRHVVARALQCGASEVIVATEDARVAEAVGDMQVRVCMTSPEHASGSDRLAECARQCDWADETLVVNLQGDEPFAPVDGIHGLVQTLASNDAPMATLATALESAQQLFDPNCVKVVCDQRGSALYFSRDPIPWARDAFTNDHTTLVAGVPVLRHIGMYAYRAGFLRQFTGLASTPLERAESLEQLRALEHGFRIAVRVLAEGFPAGIDTEDDLARAEHLLRGVSP